MVVAIHRASSIDVPPLWTSTAEYESKLCLHSPTIRVRDASDPTDASGVVVVVLQAVISAACGISWPSFW
jgi:hypothetical protein